MYVAMYNGRPIFGGFFTDAAKVAGFIAERAHRNARPTSDYGVCRLVPQVAETVTTIIYKDA